VCREVCEAGGHTSKDVCVCVCVCIEMCVSRDVRSYICISDLAM